MIGLIFVFIFFFVGSVQAQEPTSSYIIELEQIEASSEAKIQTVTEADQNILQANGFIISPQEKETSFIFSISDTNVDFSDIIAARSKINSTLLRINSANNYSYQMLASLEKPFQSSLEEIIPQTSCNKSSLCTAANPNKWTDTNSYGWGFQLSGPHVTVPLKDESYFQIFDEDKQMIFAEHEDIQGESPTKLSFKVQVPAEQKEGNYTGVIKIIALPKL